MGSLGIRGTGSGIVPVLQKAWTAAVEHNVQAHDDKLDVLRDVAAGVSAATGAAIVRLETACERLVVVAMVAAGALVATALFTAAILAVQILGLFHAPGIEVIAR